jgi:NADPH-dependent curcumin reductase CurA
MNGLLTERWPSARAELFDLYQAGKLKVVFDDQTFEGLPQVYDAVDRLLSGQSMGKVVVNLDPTAQRFPLTR